MWASRGYHVFPCKADKSPATSDGGFKNATNDLALVRALFERGAACVGVWPGPSGHVVLDVDVKEGKQGEASLTALQRELGELPDTHTQRTPSGGRHLYFRKPEDVEVGNSEIAKHIDVRSDGGYVIAYGLPPRDVATLPSSYAERLAGLTKRTEEFDWGLLDDDTRRVVEYLGERLSWKPLQENGLVKGTEWDDEAYHVRLSKPDRHYPVCTVGYANPGVVIPMSGDPAPLELTWPNGKRRAYNPEELRQALGIGKAELEMAPEGYHGLLGEAVGLFSHTEADPAAIMMCMLAGFGNMVGDSAYVETVEPIRQYARINVLVVGASAKARKSAAWGQVQKVLEAVDGKYVQNNILGGFNSGHILVDHLAKRFTAEQPQGGQDEHIYVVSKDKRMVVFEDEFVRVLKTVNADGSIYSAVLRSAFDGSKLEVRSRQKESVVPKGEHHISVLGCITAEELRGTLTNTEAYNGFGNRILYVWAKRSKNVAISDVRLDVEKLSRIADALASNVTKAQVIGRVDLDSAARGRWIQIYEEVQDDDPGGLLGTLIARADVFIQRVALILALADGDDILRIQHLNASYAIWQYCRGTAEHVFKDRALIESTNDKAHDKLKAKLYDHIYRKGSEGIQLSALKNRPIANRNDVPRVDEILAELEEEGKVTSKVIQTGKRGAPPTYYYATAKQESWTIG